MILGIDPGPETLAAVLYGSGKVTIIGDMSPEQLFATAIPAGCVAIEDFVTYQPVAAESRETIKQIGVLRWVFSNRGHKVVEIPRAVILRHVMGDTRGGDTVLRAAITDRFGGSRRAAWGVKAEPGPLYGLTGSHLLAALAVAITAEETTEKP